MMFHLEHQRWPENPLLYLLVSTRAVIGLVPLKFRVHSVAKLFCVYRQLFLTFIASKNLKLFFTLKRANDLKTISN